jgi:predicted ATPase/DNA-binding CsgD family transcriptional regulator
MTRHGDGIAERLVRAGITEREAEVLSLVSERLRNREIAARLHVSVRTVESHIASLLRKLGLSERTALVELGVELRRAAHVEAALPVPLTSLVGRDDETTELAALIGSHRLVTLVGPGGVGKTRLALRLASVQADRFSDGARFADLAPVGPELIEDTIARALGVVPQPGWSLRDILREIASGMHCLLVVDSCEHVAAEAAEIVADLLTTGTQLRVVATSREPLGVPGEVAYQVAPLSLPTSGEAPATMGTFSAVRLFVDRAVAASPGFTLDDSVAPAVAALCQRLDGLPLAIELAASLVRTFGPAELLEHLDRRFELLAGGARTAVPRQRTLRGAIDWSYDLLDDYERMFFSRLGVFPADFDFGAAQAVGGAGSEGGPSPDGGPGVMTLLPRLVDKSLVSTVGRGARRYRLLETIRAYAAERLATSGVGPAARQQHASHYLALAVEAAEQLRASNQRAWFDRLTTEQPNLRAGLAHSIATNDVESAWQWIAALQRFWDIAGQRREAHEWIERARVLGEPPAHPAVVAGLVAASAILQPSDSGVAFELAKQAAGLATDLDDLTRGRASRAIGLGAFWVEPDLVLPALHDALARFGDDHPWEAALTMQGLAQATGELAEALQWGMRSVRLFRHVEDQMFTANTLFIMAQRAVYAGVTDDEVYEWLTESQELAEAAGSEEDLAHATVGFAQLAWARHDHARAAQLMEQCLPKLRRLGDQRCTGRALYILGEHAHEKGQLVRAEELLRASVEAIALAGQSFVLVNAIEALAALCFAQGRPRPAAMLLGTADSARESASAHNRPIAPPDEELRRSLAVVLGTTAFTTAHAEGERSSPTQVLQSTASDRGDD